jgi:biotin transporter BioY
MTGPTGGFLAGYLVCVIVIALLLRVLPKNKKPPRQLRCHPSVEGNHQAPPANNQQPATDSHQPPSTTNQPTIINYILAMTAGAICLFAAGTVWFMFVTGRTLWESLSLAVFPFLLGDAVKIALAALLAKRLERYM